MNFFLIFILVLFTVSCSSSQIEKRSLHSQQDQKSYRSIANLKCFRSNHKIRRSPLDIFATLNFSRCTEKELKAGESYLKNYFKERRSLFEKAILEDNGPEQFYLLIEIEAAKASIVRIQSALDSPE